MIKKALQQSAHQLLSSLEDFNAEAIMVFGSSQQDIELLKKRWPNASVTVANADELPAKGGFDIVFSTNYLQHIPSHTALIEKLFSLLNKGGVLAVQIPNALNMPIHVMMESITRSRKWKGYFTGLTANYFVPMYYYEALCNLTDKIQLWESNHQYVFAHYQEIVDMYATTEMKVYLDRLPNDELREKLRGKVLQLLPSEYKKQSNQAILFPYRRTYFTAIKN